MVDVSPNASAGTGWVTRTHPLYKRRNSYPGGWEFLRISYEGGQDYLYPITYSVDFREPIFERNSDGTLKALAQKYESVVTTNKSMLYRHNREKEWEYFNRNKRARYFNIVKPIVNSLVSHAMKAGIVREGPKQLEEFWAGTDEKRTCSMTTFMRTGLRKANTFGIEWVCIDMAPAEAAAEGAEPSGPPKSDGKPYAYLVSPQDLLDWETDDDGNIEWLKQAIATSAKRTYMQEFKPVARYRIWTKTEVIDYETDVDQNANATGVERIVGRRPNPIGRVPFEPIFSQRDDESQFPNGVSVVADLAKVANSVFNHCSLADEIAYKQTFSWLIIPDPTKSLDAAQIGTNTAFGYDPGSTGGKPEYISPDADQLRVLMELIGNELEQARSTIGFGRGRSETSKEQASADALELESEDKKALLMDVANAGEDAERRIANLVLAYLKQPPSDTIRIVYKKDFDVGSFKADVDEALSMQKLTGMTPEVNTQLLTDLIRRKWGDSLSPKDLEALVKSVEAKAEEMAKKAEEMEAAMDGEPGPMGAMGGKEMGPDGMPLDKRMGDPQDPTSRRQPAPKPSGARQPGP